MQGRMKRKNCRPTTKKSRLQLGCVILAEWREIDTSKDSLISIVNLQSCYFVLPWFYLINNRHGCWMLQQTIWLWNQSLLQWICGKCLAWYPGRDDFLPLRLWRLIKAKNIISRHTFGTFTQLLIHPSGPVLLTKDLPRNEISYDFQPPFNLHISNSRTKPAGLDF